jgi:hypothetical protein
MELSKAELEAIRAIERGATQLRMTERIKSRLLGLGLISRPRHDFTVTEAGRRAGKHGADGWL